MNDRSQLIRVGWIGVGAMGRPMCLNLLRAGYDIAVFDRDPARSDAVRPVGVRVADTLPNLVADSDVMFSTIFDDDGLRDIVLGDEGIAAHAKPDAIFIDMSTVSPAASADVARALAIAGVRYLRGPVSGTVSLAETAQLSTFVSGPHETFDQVRPLLSHVTAKQTYVGSNEEARVVKLMINLLVFMNTATIGEALAFGARAGLERAAMVTAINESIVGCAHYRAKADKFAQRDYSPAGSLALVLKDMDLALAVANGAALPISRGVHRTVVGMVEEGLGQLDVAALSDSQDLSGVPRAPHAV